jgi:hypothetical protein
LAVKIEVLLDSISGTHKRKMSSGDEFYYDDLAEEWEARGSRGGGGGGAASKKKKAPPTTVGRQRVGGTHTWGATEKMCSKGCTKKCCNGDAKKTPSM